MAFALGAWKGARMIFTPASSRIALNFFENLESRSMIRKRVRSDDGCDPGQDTPREQLRLRCQSAALDSGKPESLALELLLQDTVLLYEIFDDFALLPIDPAGKNAQKGHGVGWCSSDPIEMGLS
jgi:hypothetical protein